jgi:hypothetical protein
MHTSGGPVDLASINQHSCRVCRIIGDDEAPTFRKPSEWIALVYVSKDGLTAPLCEKIEWYADRDCILKALRQGGVSFEYAPSVAYVISR